MVKFFEHAKRSIVKTLTYRILIIISTFTISFMVTGKLEMTLGITTAATIVNTLIYFTHERVWNKIHWGKTK